MQNQFKTNDLCPVCENSKLSSHIIDEELTFYGKTVILKDAEIFYCDICKESLYNIETEKRREKLFIQCREEYNG